ncbi:MAG TPA: tetratricopeptide repeat protein [Pyrinomonadaceae bacterium]
MMTAQLLKPPAVFVSYAREDEPYKDDLIKQLNVLEAQGVISSWHDGLLVAGEQWGETIVSQINAARIILLLISPDFMNSHYIRNVEMKRASERHEAGEVVVIPILVRNVNSWENVRFSELKLGELNALPVGAKFISQWGNRDDAFANVAGGIQRAAEKQSSGKDKAKVIAPIPRPPVVGFVARRDEQGRDIVERLKEELAPQGNQLVTLSGPGGIGKTTLAAEAARALREVFGERIVWSSAEKRADFMLPTLLDDIATQLGREDLRTLAPALKEAQVRELIADPPTLVVLDNYETIEPGAKKGIEEWFAPAQCSALLTSRHGIRWTHHITIAAMSREEAQEYLERLVTETQDEQIFSAEVRQHIYETAEANPYVMQWVVAQIGAAQEPGTVLKELAQGEGDAASRVYDRSFNLEQLGDDGRAALLALSLFVPSAARDALAEVAGFGGDLKRVSEAVKNLRALWLIKGIDENRRFTIEGLTRSMTRARLLKDSQAGEFRQRFVAHFLSYAEAHAQPTPEDFDALEAEKDNLSSAMDAAFELEDWASVMRIRFALEKFLDLHGYWDEAIRSGKQALTAARHSQIESSVAGLAHNLAVTHYRRGELESARRLYNESLEIAKRLGNQSGIASTLHELGRLAQSQGEIEEPRRLYSESLEINKGLSDQSGISSTLHQLAMLAQSQGEIEEARRLYNESLEIAKRLGDQSGIAITLHQLGMLAEVENNKVEAVRLFREALGIFERLKSPDAEIARRSLERVEREGT